MGEDRIHSQFSKEDFEIFSSKLKQETNILTEYFRQKEFVRSENFVGLELETWIVDKKFLPAPENEKILDCLNHPFIVPELSRFNVEFNITPLPIRDSILKNMEEDLTQYWANCQACARNLGLEMLMIGTLPTVKKRNLSLKNMSSKSRYQALNRQVMAFRGGKPLTLDIQGKDHLKTTCKHVMLESAATSIQIHLQVNQEEAARYFNASQILSPLLVAAGANSPFLFGLELWDESRIPLFEQAVAVGDPRKGKYLVEDNRVTFGQGFIRDSLMECFQENLERYPVFIPILSKKEPKYLDHLRLHNGTIWRWNRPLIGFDASANPHLRIEQRVVAAGPTIPDVVANIALFIGGVSYLSSIPNAPEKQISFSEVKKNFYEAARFGLQGKIRWLDGRENLLQKIILENILPHAKESLLAKGVAAGDVQYYLGEVMENRIRSQQNGAFWQREYYRKNGKNFKKLVQAYCLNQNAGKPVFDWDL